MTWPPPDPSDSNLCRVYGNFVDLSNYPAWNVPVQAEMLSPSRLGVDTSLGTFVRSVKVTTLTDRDGRFQMDLRRNVEVMLAIGGEYEVRLNVPDLPSIDLAKWAFPYPVEVTWGVIPPDGCEIELLEDEDEVRLGATIVWRVVWSNEETTYVRRAMLLADPPQSVTVKGILVSSSWPGTEIHLSNEDSLEDFWERAGYPLEGHTEEVPYFIPFDESDLSAPEDISVIVASE